jgi:hypothetical protein
MPGDKQGMRGLQIYKGNSSLPSLALPSRQTLTSLPADIFRKAEICTPPELILKKDDSRKAMANKRVDYTPNEQSILYGETGGACPLCARPIIFKKAASKHPEKGYEIAHIYPLNPTPAQAKALVNYATPVDRNALENVICLCPSCHREYDKDFKIEEYLEILGRKKSFLQMAQAKLVTAECHLKEEVKNLLQTIIDLTPEDIAITEVELDIATINDKLKTNASPLLKRNIKRDVLDYYVTIRDEIRILEQRDQLTVRVLQNQINTYYLEMQRIIPDNKDLVFTYITQWMSTRTGKSIDAAKILTSFFVQNCEVFDVSSK